MKEEAWNYAAGVIVCLGALIWWLVRAGSRAKGAGSSGHFSPRDPSREDPPDHR